MRRSRLSLGAFLALGATGLAAPATAQDIELRAAQSGRQLPRAYHERIARDPSAFELGAGWRARLAAAASAPAGQAIVSGTLRVAVIPTLFSNSAPPPELVSAAALQDALFDGPATETVSGYYAEVSRGKLTLTGRVTSWVSTSLTVTQVVGTSMGLGSDAQVGPWLRQAIAAADAELDFGLYDNDGPDGSPNSGDDDGVVDAAAFLFHEIDAACGGPAIWPHRSRVSNWSGGTGPAPTNDLRPDGQPIVVNDYIVLGARECTGTARLGANVVAHELGHALGLPDYYDLTLGVQPQLRRWVVGCWELMSAASWGCGSGEKAPTIRPAHMGPYPKQQLQWITPIDVPAGARRLELTLNPVRASGEVLSVPLSANEHLLIEYRDRSGFDSALPAAGVLVYRRESGRSWLPPANAMPRTYSYALVEADANGALLRTEQQGGNRGEAGDAFRSSGTLNNISAPAITLNDGRPSSVTIHSITIDQAANVATVTLTTASTPEFAAPVLPQLAAVVDTVSHEMVVNGGAAPYSASVGGTLPAGMSFTVHGDRVRLSGTPLASGTFPVTLTVRDALGVPATQAITLTVTGLVADAARLFGALPGGTQPLTAAERAYFDEMGNRNGQFDVGDVRAHLKRTSALRRR